MSLCPAGQQQQRGPPLMQLTPAYQLETKLLDKCRPDAPDALLCVSGSHPLRSLAPVSWCGFDDADRLLLHLLCDQMLSASGRRAHTSWRVSSCCTMQCLRITSLLLTAACGCHSDGVECPAAGPCQIQWTCSSWRQSSSRPGKFPQARSSGLLATPWLSQMPRGWRPKLMLGRPRSSHNPPSPGSASLRGWPMRSAEACWSGAVSAPGSR
jgi:hypothetical protein